MQKNINAINANIKPKQSPVTNAILEVSKISLYTFISKLILWPVY